MQDERAQRAQVVAKELLEQLVAGDYVQAMALCGALLRKSLSAEQLAIQWQGLEAEVGEWQQLVSVNTQQIRQFEFVCLRCDFARARIDIQLALDAQLQVMRLRFLAVPGVDAGEAPPPENSAPAYVAPATFEETELNVGMMQWPLPAVFTCPVGEGPFPAVLLVHGSGPQDRDQTVGVNKPFRDIAQGLASRGIAVLRYEKRTQHYADRLAEQSVMMTTDVESTQDAVAIASLLRTLPGVDSRRVFIAGHSLGGALLPRILMREPLLAGGIVLAGPSRPFEDCLYDQACYLLARSGLDEAEQAEQLSMLKAQIQRVKYSHQLREAEPEDLPLGLPASYWHDLRGYKPASQAARLPQPLLILQGGRDYQVTSADFELWQQALLEAPRARFRLFPGLNHLFMRGHGESGPAEYQQAGHVDQTVIDCIADWVRGISG